MSTVEKYIRSIPDFPKQGIISRDITTVTQDPEGLQLAIKSMEDKIKDKDFDVIVGLEARGFMFGTPIAFDMKKAFVPIRKKRESFHGKQFQNHMIWNMEVLELEIHTELHIRKEGQRRS